MTNTRGTTVRGNRREEILQSLARMLENSPGNKITTAALAKDVGVSEAALYRHFPSKAKMFDALLDFVEDSLFSRISKITSQDLNSAITCSQIYKLVLQFAERNPGMCRILTGDALIGENDRLAKRNAQIMLRLETQLKQLFREAELKDGLRFSEPLAICVQQVCAVIDGKILQYVRSNFSSEPTKNVDSSWQLLETAIFRD